MSHVPRKRRRLRLSLGGMMTLVALAAVVLTALERRERGRRAKIARAYARMEASPHLGISRENSRASLGETSADGRFVEVRFLRPDGFEAILRLPADDPPAWALRSPAAPPAPGTAPPSPPARPGTPPTKTP